MNFYDHNPIHRPIINNCQIITTEPTMGSVYEEVEIEDMQFDEKTQLYTYPCPCGDKFNISLVEVCYVTLQCSQVICLSRYSCSVPLSFYLSI